MFLHEEASSSEVDTEIEIKHLINNSKSQPEGILEDKQ